MGEPAERRTGIRVGGVPDSLSAFLTGDSSRDLRNMNILLEAIAAVNSNPGMDSLVVHIVDLALELTKAERGFLLLHEGQDLRVRASRGPGGRRLPPGERVPRTLPARVAREGRAICQRDDALPEGSDRSATMADLDLRTVMCAPLRLKDRVLGVLYVDSRAEAREFGDSDLTLLSALATQAAITLDGARLLEHYVEKQRIQQGLLIARDIQRALLPEGPLSLPGLDVHGTSVGCEETSGDYFDYIRTGEGRVGLVVGDVAGHGVPAALLMATARALLRAFLRADADPAATLGSLNACLCEDMAAGRFMTLFYGDLDVPRRRLSYVRAGHTPPLLLRAATGECEELAAPGIALGVEPDARYRASEPVEIGAGDVLFLFTDGIVETMSPGREPFGVERAAAVLRRHGDRSAEEICVAMRRAVDAFRGSSPPEDDLTMIVARGL